MEVAEVFMLFGDGRSRHEVLKRTQYVSIGLQAREFIESRGFRWSRESGDVLLKPFNLKYAPTPEQLECEMRRRKLEFPQEQDALRLGEMLARADAREPELPRCEPESLTFYHKDNPWKRNGQASVLTLDLFRGYGRRLRCMLVGERLTGQGDCRFIGRVP